MKLLGSGIMLLRTFLIKEPERKYRRIIAIDKQD